MKKLSPTFFVILLLLGLFMLHLPFLQADPPSSIDNGSRGPLTDEGQYTCQLRNFLNHGILDIHRSDGMVKTPGFQALLVLPLWIFGTHLLAGRLVVLCFLLISLLLIGRDKYFKPVVIVFALGGLLEEHVFQFSHFCMAEIAATGSILFSFYFLSEHFLSSSNQRLFMSVMMASLAWFIKIQFAYLASLIPGFFFLRWLMSVTGEKRSAMRPFLLSTAYTLLFALVYLCFWYLPFHKDINYVLGNQGTAHFPPKDYLFPIFRYNFEKIFGPGGLFLFSLQTAGCLITGILLSFRKDFRHFRMLFGFLSLWIALEFHKVFMQYIPFRYLISLFFAMGLLNALVIAGLLRISLYRKKKPGILNFAGTALALTFIAGGLYDGYEHYLQDLTARTYEIEEANRYMSQYSYGSRPVIGPWAPTITWDAKAISFPVWKDYYNDRHILESFRPLAIVAERNEDDANQAFASDGIVLQQAADSSHQFQIGPWPVRVYWLRAH